MSEPKISMHLGRKWNSKHNLREYDVGKWNTDGHIQTERSALNKVLQHEDLRTFFYSTFGDSIMDFNEKNRSKHPDRLIGFKSAAEYDAATPEERRQKAVTAYYKEQKGRAQECIIQLGNHEDYMQLVASIGREKADKLHQEFLEKAYQQWCEENPSLRVFSAITHMDETKDGTPHLHLDFIPTAESARGLTVKVSMDGAMKQLGFERKENDKYAETPYKRWLAHQRKSVEQLASEYMEITPSEHYSKQHRQETWQWRAEQKEQELQDKQEEIQQKSSEKQNLEAELESIQQDIVAAMNVPPHPMPPAKPNHVRITERRKDYIKNHTDTSLPWRDRRQQEKEIGETWDEWTADYARYDAEMKQYEAAEEEYRNSYGAIQAVKNRETTLRLQQQELARTAQQQAMKDAQQAAVDKQQTAERDRIQAARAKLKRDIRNENDRVYAEARRMYARRTGEAETAFDKEREKILRGEDRDGENGIRRADCQHEMG